MRVKLELPVAPPTPEYGSITLVIETKAEADALWHCLNQSIHAYATERFGDDEDKRTNLCTLSSSLWLAFNAKHQMFDDS